MSYPKMRGKHLEAPIISQKEYLQYSRKIGRKPRFMPPSIILSYSSRMITQLQSIHKITAVPGIFETTATKLYSVGGTNNAVGILAEFGVGAPSTVMHMEELMAWGAKRFVILGMAGAISEKLKPGDLVVCTKSIRDEGTSHHYVKNSKFAFSSTDLSRRLFHSLAEQFPRVFKGASWTIDAPYRETVKELIHYRAAGVMTVEMEASAVFAIGRLRGIETAAVFAVSDLLSEKGWKPSIQSPFVLRRLVRAFSFVKDVLAASPVDALTLC
jgi:uridine phosphorylase